MAKSNRAAADRKKIEAVTASKTIEVSDCGTIFTAVGDVSGLILTLPSIAQAGKGWWCKLVKTGAAGGEAIGLNAHADDGNAPFIGIEASQAFEAITLDDLAIAAVALAGAMIEVICDGTRWIALSAGHDAGGAGAALTDT